jgi:hypothetical protein
VATLADEMIAGLTEHAAVYPDPPVTVANMTGVRDAYAQARTDLLTRQTVAKAARTSKDSILGHLTTAMKKNIRYAETTVGADSEQLGLIGWGPRSAPTPLAPAGQARELLATHQGEHTVDLIWKAPVTGGRPSAYRVTRRERPAGPWLDVATALTTEIHLTDQERGKEFEYRVIAANRAGEGEPSNTVVVVL